MITKDTIVSINCLLLQSIKAPLNVVEFPNVPLELLRRDTPRLSANIRRSSLWVEDDRERGRSFTAPGLFSDTYVSRRLPLQTHTNTHTHSLSLSHSHIHIEFRLMTDLTISSHDMELGIFQSISGNCRELMR